MMPIGNQAQALAAAAMIRGFCPQVSVLLTLYHEACRSSIGLERAASA